MREALTRFQREYAKKSLLKSADLYAEVYGEDKEVRELTEAALAGWPA